MGEEGGGREREERRGRGEIERGREGQGEGEREDKMLMYMSTCTSLAVTRIILEDLSGWAESKRQISRQKGQFTCHYKAIVAPYLNGNIFL